MFSIRENLRLLREVHAAEEGLEAGVGAEGVEGWPRIKVDHHHGVLVGGLLQPGDGLRVVAYTYADLSQKETTEVLLAPPSLQILEDGERFLFLPGESQDPAEKCLCSRVAGADESVDLLRLSRRGGPHPLDRCSSQLRWNPGS